MRVQLPIELLPREPQRQEQELELLLPLQAEQAPLTVVSQHQLYCPVLGQAEVVGVANRRD